MEEMIAANDFCNHYNVEYSFIKTLSDSGLIQITTIEERRFISSEQLPHLERLIRLHNDLDINVEGLEAICSLLQRIEVMQDEITYLKNRLRVFEHEM